MSEQVLTINKADRRTPWAFKLRSYGKPLDIASLTVQIFGYDDAGTAWITATATGITKQPTVTFTASATTNRLTANEHLVEDGDEIVVANSGGALPTGLAAATRYFARDVEPNTFRLSESPSGPAIDITGAGTGTNTYYIVGSVQYAPVAADVDTAGTFWAWLKVIDGSSLVDTYPIHRSPKNRGYKVEIVEAS